MEGVLAIWKERRTFKRAVRILNARSPLLPEDLLQGFIEYITENAEKIFAELGIASAAEIDLPRLEKTFNFFLDDEHADEGNEWNVESAKFVPRSKAIQFRKKQQKRDRLNNILAHEAEHEAAQIEQKQKRRKVTQ